jgi:hypothetical protein
MSKMKISFSLLFTIFLVGILATSTFARGAFWQGLSPNGTGGFDYKFINTTETAAVDFTVTVYSNADNYATALGSKTVTSTANYTEPTGATAEYNTASFASTDVTGGVNVGTIYKFVLSYVDGATVNTGVQYGVLTDEKNLNLASIAASPTGVTVNVDGSKLYNANHTGTSSAAKKPNQNTHGFYQNNTNSCAGCHQTHTAADGEYLLFKDGIYSTCSACHDGTTGAYNAFGPANVDTPQEIAGTFNVNSADKTSHNGSLHQADGSLDVSAAPGGNRHGSETGASALAKATYGSEFDCASCHAPHGSGSSSENNLNLDPLGWGGVAYNGTTPGDDANNGKLFKGVEIASSVPTTSAGHTPFILVKKTTTTSDISTDKTKAGYLYYRAGVTAGDVVLQTYRWDGQKYVADYSLFLRDVGHVSSPFSNANTAFYKTSGADLVDMSKEINVVWRDGFAFGSSAAIANVTKADISLGIDVETTNNIASLFDSKNANYVYDSGTEMSKYCASCHVDYLSTTRGNNTGTYTTAHRHATAQDRLSCVRCHFGHGSDATIMKDSNDQSQFNSSKHAGDLTYFVDPNPSSALKRYTGMSVCYSCHGHGEQFLGNPNVNHNQSTDADVKAIYGSHSVGNVTSDYLLNGDPGAARTDRTDVTNP